MLLHALIDIALSGKMSAQNIAMQNEIFYLILSMYMCYNMAMKTKNGNLHLEIQTSRKSAVGILRTSYYDDGRVNHTQHGRITGCTQEQLKILQKAFREQVIPADDTNAFKILQSKEYGQVSLFWKLSNKLDWTKLFSPKKKPGLIQY